MHDRLGRLFLLMALAGVCGCGGPGGPQWTYYAEGPYQPLPAGHAPTIFYAVDQVSHLRGTAPADSTVAPPHTAIASVANCRLGRDDVLARARAMGADAVIVTPESKDDDPPGSGAREPGRRITAATFVVFETQRAAVAAGDGTD